LYRLIVLCLSHPSVATQQEARGSPERLRWRKAPHRVPVCSCSSSFLVSSLAYSRKTSPFITVFAYPLSSTLLPSLSHTTSISPPRVETCRHLRVFFASCSCEVWRREVEAPESQKGAMMVCAAPVYEEERELVREGRKGGKKGGRDVRRGLQECRRRERRRGSKRRGQSRRAQLGSGW
jgi:hypothetical protein